MRHEIPQGWSLGKLHKPETRRDQDFWSQEMDLFDPDGNPGMQLHRGAVEVHAETKHEVHRRSKIILRVLNANYWS